jgi:hypothetical protein
VRLREIVKVLRNRLELKDEMLENYQREIELADRGDFGESMWFE